MVDKREILYVAFVGGRDRHDTIFVLNVMKKIVRQNRNYKIHIISGGAKGIDTISINCAKELNLDYVIYKPDLKTYPYHIYRSKAYMLRNKLICDNSDMLVAFPSNNSKGTWNTINYWKEINGHAGLIIFNEKGKVVNL